MAATPRKPPTPGSYANQTAATSAATSAAKPSSTTNVRSRFERICSWSVTGRT